MRRVAQLHRQVSSLGFRMILPLNLSRGRGGAGTGDVGDGGLGVWWVRRAPVALVKLGLIVLELVKTVPKTLNRKPYQKNS